MNNTNHINTVREALEHEIRIAKQDSIDDVHGYELQYSLDNERTLEKFNVACSQDEFELELKDFGPSWTTLFIAVNACVQNELANLLQSNINETTLSALRNSVDRFIAAAEWLNTIYVKAYNEQDRPLNSAAYSWVAVDVIAARAVFAQPDRVEEILDLRDLSRAVADLDSQALMARLEEPDQVRKSSERVQYYNSRLRNVLILAKGVKPSFVESGINEFSQDNYEDLTRNLQYVNQLIKESA